MVLHNVLLLELPHALNFVQIDYETFIVSVQRLDALSTENVEMVRAVKVLHSLRMLLT